MADISQLVAGEIACLRALEDQRWKTSIEVGIETDLPGFAVRSMLKHLRDQAFVRRGQGKDDVGKWTITDYGIGQLNLLRQLRLA